LCSDIQHSVSVFGGKPFNKAALAIAQVLGVHKPPIALVEPKRIPIDEPPIGAIPAQELQVRVVAHINDCVLQKFAKLGVETGNGQGAPQTLGNRLLELELAQDKPCLPVAFALPGEECFQVSGEVNLRFRQSVTGRGNSAFLFRNEQTRQTISRNDAHAAPAGAMTVTMS